MSKFISLFFCLLLCSVTLQAQDVNTLQNIIVKDYPSERAIQIELMLDNTQQEYQIGLQNSNLLVITIANTTRNLVNDLVPQQKDIIKSIDVNNIDKNMVIAIGIEKPVKYYAWQIDNKLVINIQLDDAKQSDALSFRIYNTSIRSTLKYVAEQLDVNMIISDAVQGSIILDFRNVPKNKVLDLILQAKQLTYIKHEPIYLIVPKQATSKINLAFTTVTYNTKSIKSMDFENIEVARTLLKVLSSVSGKNIVASQSNLGTVTMRIKNIPWSQILADVIAIKGLTVKEIGNSMIVSYL